MERPKRKAGKPKIQIKDLGADSGKELGRTAAAAIRGGKYTCPSGPCKSLVVITKRAKGGTHTVIIDLGS